MHSPGPLARTVPGNERGQMTNLRKPMSPRIRFEIFKRDGFRCAYCGSKPGESVLRVDHVVPIADGGTDDPQNLVTACDTCNAGKGAVPLEQKTYGVSAPALSVEDTFLAGLPSAHEEEVENCSRSFAGFAKRAWPVIERHTPLLWEQHVHDPIAMHIQELIQGFVRMKLHQVAQSFAHNQLPRVSTARLPLGKEERQKELRRRAELAHLWATGRRLEVLLRSGRCELKPQVFNKLLINVGPGYGKSRMASVLAPGWLWLLWPHAIEHSYSVNPRGAAKESSAQLALITSDWWRRTFHPWWGMTSSKPAESYFRNTAGGERKASGWGAQVQGDHADFQIIDDPEDPKKVYSDGEREATRKAWDGRISRRLQPGGVAIVLAVEQKLHPKDWSDHFITSTDTEHLMLSTIAIEEDQRAPHPCPCPTHIRGQTSLGWKDKRKPGELLAPRLVPEKEVAARRRNTLVFAAQDQQRPKDLTGNVFPEEKWWFWRFADEPDVEELKQRTFIIPVDSGQRRHLAEYFEDAMLAGDLSFGLTQDGSYDCIGAWGRKGHRRMLFDIRWEPMKMTRARAAVRELLEEYPWIGPKVLERAANASAVSDSLTEGAESMGEEAVEGIVLRPAEGSKAYRAVSIQHLHEAGNLLLPLHHHQRPEMIAEAKAFPQKGRRNDFVDMTSLAQREWQQRDSSGIDHLYPRPK